jgi:uncharacterized protein (DUF1015 family)
MADLRPFRALRPRVDLAPWVIAPPYDVVDTAEARALAEGNPDSFLHVSRPEINLPDGVPADSEEVHAAGRQALDHLIFRGAFVLDPAPCYSVYRLRRGEHVQTGLVAAAGIADYTSGTIRTHEQTRHDKEADRVNHLEALSAPDDPAWKPVAELLDRITARAPSIDLVTDDDIGHTLWRVDDEAEISELRAAATALPELYVADGHHRSAAAARVAAAHDGADGTDAFPVVVFPGEELEILPYNRVLTDLGGRDPQRWLADLAHLFDITALGPRASGEAEIHPAGRREFAMYCAGAWFRLRLRDGAADLDRLTDPVTGLDVSLLQDLVLGPGLGILDPRTDTRIAFVGGIRGTAELERLVDSGSWAAAFALHPTSVPELVSVAATGRDMPPKSTWFEPKLRSGLFVHRFAG